MEKGCWVAVQYWYCSFCWNLAGRVTCVRVRVRMCVRTSLRANLFTSANLRSGNIYVFKIIIIWGVALQSLPNKGLW